LHPGENDPGAFNVGIYCPSEAIANELAIQDVVAYTMESFSQVLLKAVEGLFINQRTRMKTSPRDYSTGKSSKTRCDRPFKSRSTKRFALK
jgi:hypothetical protein